ncbi:hypothetical protein fugu_004086 [Takifugu bimaculatus]|uniref:EGF-like domain-containing protein n=1 Tax=Takifugu bimaculatus TaxID=433685 RepID=A0A4Z2BCJ1_9TELE|nr:hypothetical protein fugu_004086 [Takifugu bimaculatus]
MMMIGGRTKLLEICCCLLLFSQESQCGDPQTQHLSSYQLTVPRPVGGRFRREADGTLPSQVSYIIPVDGLDHIVHLQRNQLLLPADFTVFSYSQNGSLITSRPPVQNHCHYHGFVENMPESSVAMSICNGLRGVLRLPDNSYGIEPLESDPNQHLLYRLQDMKRAVLHQTHYVELLLVVDNDRFNYMNRNDTAVREEMVHLANFIDSIYIQLNVRVVLVGLEIWTQQNLISTDGGAGEVLSRFTQWREKALVPRRRHDSAQLILESRNFSSCSADDFEKMILLTGGTCLLNVPHPDEAYSSPYCGNRLVDVGEECDCGSQKSDVFVQNGQPCRSQQAYCYNGKCRHHDGQCQDIFGSKAKASPEICFKDVNNKGDRFGNCGYHNYGYKKCESRNALCGKLQCSNIQTSIVFGIQPSIISTSIGGAKCYGVDFRLGSDVCVNFECRSADILNYDCDVEKKCHGHGVCNSNKNCHCDDGWAPPFCELQGYGGSVDSGPTWNDKDTSLRDGLLVFFFLILPLLILTAFVYLRKNEFLRCLGLQRRKRSEAYQVDKATPVNRSRGPPPRVPPPVSLGNSDNVRDGHHAQLLLPPQVVETSRTAPAFAPRPPPPPLKPKPPPASHPLVPQRPAPAPPV